MTTTTGHALLTLSSKIKNNPITVDPIKGQNYDCHAVLFIHSGHFCRFFQKIVRESKMLLGKYLHRETEVAVVQYILKATFVM